MATPPPATRCGRACRSCTLAGTNYASRFGSSAHVNLDLQELIAESPEQYVKIAAHLARDLDRLAGAARRLAIADGIFATARLRRLHAQSRSRISPHVARVVCIADGNTARVICPRAYSSSASTDSCNSHQRCSAVSSSAEISGQFVVQAHGLVRIGRLEQLGIDIAFLLIQLGNRAFDRGQLFAQARAAAWCVPCGLPCCLACP